MLALPLTAETAGALTDTERQAAELLLIPEMLQRVLNGSSLPAHPYNPQGGRRAFLNHARRDSHHVERIVEHVG